ncbi:MAG: M15 family metallopeptidase [bacterium]
MRASLTILAVAIVTTLCCRVGAGEVEDTTCHDSVVVDTVTYMIPAWWCSHKLDTIDLADPAVLVRLPERFCELAYQIYLERSARDALVVMAEAALRDSVRLLVRSGYRSPGYQLKLLRRRLANGQSFRSIMWAVAPPGYSQHHTGRAVDLTTADTTSVPFAQRKAYRWLRANADRFGFSETYPPENESPPAAEPWHWYHSGSDKVLDAEVTAD